MSRYVALVDGKPGAYGVVAPDLPGWRLEGSPSTMRYARNAVGEAVTLWSRTRAPTARKSRRRAAEKLRSNPEVAAALVDGGVLAYVPLTAGCTPSWKANSQLDPACQCDR